MKRRHDSAQAHSALGYVLRYAGLLEEAARECDASLALDPTNYLFRSCATVFIRLGNYGRALDFIRLDAGSESSNFQLAQVLLHEGKWDEALQTLERLPPGPQWDRDLLVAFLRHRPASEIEAAAKETEARVMADRDPEPKFNSAADMALAGQKESALRLLRRAIEQNYCSHPEMDTDPLLAGLRGTRTFASLRTLGADCQKRFLAYRAQAGH